MIVSMQIRPGDGIDLECLSANTFSKDEWYEEIPNEAMHIYDDAE